MEFEEIVNKTKNDKGIPLYDKFTEEDILRLQTIFFAMSRDQQDKQMVAFVPSPPPMPRTLPTKEQLESWKNPKIYGVWINDKRINNTELNKFSDTSFAHFFLSKLEKNAINYGKHYYQVNLMTGEKYDVYLQNAVKNQKKYLMFYRTGNARYPLFQGVRIDS
ncbi:hypothetical protein [Flavitalea sp.]|nr:hypothetical protein [Flavitalea sp.]